MRKTYLKNKKITSALQDALLKKAMGYVSSETIEEYASAEDQLTLTKKKVTTKEVPPDTTALKALLDMLGMQSENNISELTDEQLEEEKQQILKQLKGEN